MNEGRDAFRDLLVSFPRADVTVGSKIYRSGASVFVCNSGAPFVQRNLLMRQAGALFGALFAAAVMSMHPAVNLLRWVRRKSTRLLWKN